MIIDHLAGVFSVNLQIFFDLHSARHPHSSVFGASLTLSFGAASIPSLFPTSIMMIKRQPIDEPVVDEPRRLIQQPLKEEVNEAPRRLVQVLRRQGGSSR